MKQNENTGAGSVNRDTLGFNQDSVWNLTPIDPKDVVKDVQGLLITGETIEAAFRTVRDQLVFTNKRVIAVDVQGVWGVKRSYATMPYKNVQFFTVQTPGLFEIVADSELVLWFSNHAMAKFEFRGNVDVGKLSRLISEYML